MGKAEVYAEILREYEIDRDNSQRMLAERKKSIYEAIPRIKDIDYELSKTGAGLARLFLENNKAENALENARAKNKELIAEKEKLMEQNGFASDYLLPVYKCEVCKDTGYYDNQRCKCFKQRLIHKYYDMSNIGHILKDENFDSFDFRYYSKEIDSKENVSPYENMQKIFSIALNAVKDIDKTSSNLFFYGSAGVGKTFLCNCIAKDVIEMGKTVIYVSAFQLFEMIIKSKFGKQENSELDETLAMLLEADLLIIDDLGTENINSITNASLFDIMNSRLMNKRSTIISSNLAPSDMFNIYSERIVSRLYGQYKICHFIGSDIRILKRTRFN